jgi:hypothetical protein
MELPQQNDRNHSDAEIDVCCEAVTNQGYDNDTEKIMAEETEVENEGVDMEVEYITSQ